MCSIKGLQRTLRKRLPAIDRWRAVNVYRWDDKKLPNWVTPDKDTVIIYWHRPKGKNFHPYEYKEFPISDLPLVRQRNSQRLRNNTKTWK